MIKIEIRIISTVFVENALFFCVFIQSRLKKHYISRDSTQDFISDTVILSQVGSS